jgi:hypothetical protein
MYFQNGYRSNHKELENSKETGYIFVNVGYSISATNGALITTKGKWNLKCKRHNVACDRTIRTHSLAPWIPRPYFMLLLPMGVCERPGIPTSDGMVLIRSFESKLHRPLPVLVGYSYALHGKNLNVVLLFAK